MALRENHVFIRCHCYLHHLRVHGLHHVHESGSHDAHVNLEHGENHDDYGVIDCEHDLLDGQINDESGLHDGQIDGEIVHLNELIDCASNHHHALIGCEHLADAHDENFTREHGLSST